jgi:uncharacterized protein (TIGR04141 family)
LKPDCFELGFGLRAALNRVDVRKIRCLDLKNYEDLVVSMRKQTSRNSELGSFGLDVARDLVRAVTGEPTDATFAIRITGSDACSINVKITAGGLGKKCEQLYDAWKDSKYKQHFEWIDYLNEVRDSSLVAKLEDALLRAVKSGKDDLLHLAPAEPIDWQDVDKFRVTGTRAIEYDDLDLDKYLSNLGTRVDSLTVEKLKSYRVMVRWSGSVHFQSRWTLFSCLVWETTLKGQLYALVEGRWFEIEKSFAKRVRAFVKSLPAPKALLPDAKSGESEEKYNKRIARGDSDLVCLDRVLVKPADGVTPIEFCDLFSKRKELIHVKKKTRSATLSHLFSQGTVSARAFVQDGALRDQVLAKLKKTSGKTGFDLLIPDGKKRPVAAEYAVIYGVVAKPRANWPESLPFFSQLNLMQHAKQLQEMGFGVNLQLISEV